MTEDRKTEVDNPKPYYCVLRDNIRVTAAQIGDLSCDILNGEAPDICERLDSYVGRLYDIARAMSESGDPECNWQNLDNLPEGRTGQECITCGDTQVYNRPPIAEY